MNEWTSFKQRNEFGIIKQYTRAKHEPIVKYHDGLRGIIIIINESLFVLS